MLASEKINWKVVRETYKRKVYKQLREASVLIATTVLILSYTTATTVLLATNTTAIAILLLVTYANYYPLLGSFPKADERKRVK